MKKLKIFIVLVLAIVLMPFSASAKDGKAVSETLADAAKQEEITFNHPKYTNSDSKVNVYLFRGHGCGYCHNLLTFLETIVDDYGKYFNLVSYEVWYDTDNYNLMQTVASVFGESADGVPYLVIGDKTFVGYSSSYDDSIKTAIKELYNSKDKYDVMNHLDEAKPVQNNQGTGTTTTTTEDTAKKTSTFGNYVKENKNSILTVCIGVIVLGALYVLKSNMDYKKLCLELYNEVDALKEDIEKMINENTKTEKNTKKKN